MNICIVGWYGSETLGDRAILDGIITILSRRDEKTRLYLGSLHPFFSERTIFEDSFLYDQHNMDISIEVFDEENRKALANYIKKSDIVAMGGGPLDAISQLFIIRDAFSYAHKIGIKTALLGCGYSMISHKTYLKCLSEIISNSDLIIMRDKFSRDRMINDLKVNCANKFLYSLDPAEISVIDYESTHHIENDNREDYWIINIRDLDYVYGNKYDYNQNLFQIIKEISAQIKNIRFMPMHSFYLGSDDRYIENKFSNRLGRRDINVIQNPPTLSQAYDLIMKCRGCIGVRYHSTVFETYLNGNNYIIDYTDPINGKVMSFVRSLENSTFYKNRYVNALIKDQHMSIHEDNQATYTYSKMKYKEAIEFYNNCISDALQR